MNQREPKLVELYEDYLAIRDGRVALHTARVASWYSPATLLRLMDSPQASVRQAAAWGLGLIGSEVHLDLLGRMLSDCIRGVRSSADEARRNLLTRTQSPWHRRCEQTIEEMLAQADLQKACTLADQLVEETEFRSDAFLLRAWVRFCNQQMELAILDCKKTLSIDPYCYRACVALGQCYWYQQQDATARECFYESVRLYPDWEPAHAALRMVQTARTPA